MGLSLVRRKLRAEALMIAGQMIEDYLQGGVTPEEFDLTEEEFAIFHEENMRLAEILYKKSLKYHVDI